ncbi:uncharacterized protein [Eucyclogobius newberryi]|uniref:uncharacterized protein n=1 Tax=Eucyclogobius newberryi TaxID=166745 RepID=UPI003B59099D
METWRASLSMQETDCLLKIAAAAAAKLHQRLDSSSTSQDIIEDILKEMSVQGYDLTSEQILDKLKTLKTEYMAQKKYPDQEAGNCLWPKIDLDVVDFILGDKDECMLQTTDTVKTETTEDVALVNSSANTGLPSSSCDPVLSAEQDMDTMKMEPMEYNAPIQLAIDPALCSSDLKMVSEASDCRSFHSRPPLRPMQKMNSEKWIDSEVHALLSVYAATKMQRHSEGHKTNNKIFDSISKELEHFGVHHTPKQCREKIKKLKQDYKKIKDYNNLNGAEIKTGKWYDILDSILGQHPFYSGTGAPTSENSAEEFMDSTCTENNTQFREELESVCTENDVESRGNPEGPQVSEIVPDPDRKAVLQLSIDAGKSLCSLYLQIVK